MISQYLIVVVGATAAVVNEAIFRMHGGSYNQIFPLALFLALATNYGVFYTMKTGNSLIEGLIVWTVMTSTLRVAATFFLKETPGWNQWLAFGLVVLAGFVSKLWKAGS